MNGLLQSAFSWLSRLVSRNSSGNESPTSAPNQSGLQVTRVAWGSHPKVSQGLLDSVAWTCLELMPNRSLSEFMSEMLSCMAFETAETFDPGIKNFAGSSGTGLIQFMRTTAIGLGTSVESLALMSQSEQMAYVYKYFKPYAGRLNNIGDVYLAIFYPAAMGKPDDHIIFSKGTKGYVQNRGLDRSNKGYFTRADAAYQAQQKLDKGLKQYAFDGKVVPYKSI